MPLRRLLLPVCVSTLLLATVHHHYFQDPKVQSRAMLPQLDLNTRMDLAMEQEIARTMDPALGFVPRNRLVLAYDLAQAKRAVRSELILSAITGVNWTERGPTNVGGRTRTIMVDPNDGTFKSIFAASISGGLWKTADITKENPEWVSVNDFFENMAITTLAYDPSNTNIMYFGTGEGFFNIDAVQGNGIWKSTDEGNTWSQLSGTVTDNFSTCAGDGDCDFLYVNKIVVTSSGTILAATRSKFTNRGGIMRSTDGGTNWTKVLTGLSGTNSCTGNTYRHRASDIEIAADGDIFASLGIFENQGIWRSTDDGATWGSPVYTSTCSEQRIELATAPLDANYIYALVQEDDNTINRIMRSTNGGTSWSSVGTPAPSWFDQNCASASTDFTRNQAWYDLTVAVDPNDRDVVYIGGIDLLRTVDGGSTWTQMTNWAGNCDYPEVHADQHTIIYQPGSSDIIYFGNDGGIYQTTNASSSSPTFTRKEFGYNTTQFYSVAVNPTAGSSQVMGGTQDNGSNKLTNLELSGSVEVTGGDGGFAHIDQNESGYQFTAFTGATINRSTDGGLTFSNILNNSNGQFINPSDYADSDNFFYGAFIAGQYFFSDNIQTTADFFSSGNVSAFNSGEVTAVTASPNTSERVWFGLDNGRVVRVNNAVSTINDTNITGSGFPSGSVSCIAVETGNDSHLLVTFFNYGVTSIWETTDGGSNWTAVEGDLPDMPIRWALFNPSDSDQALVATELGVWSTDNLDGASTDWEPSNNGLANVRTDMLQIRSSDNLVMAATHGRGLFASDIFTTVKAEFSANKNVVYAESGIDFSDASYKATSWAWEFGDGGVSSDQHPSHVYKRSGMYEVTLTINGGASTETKTDFIHVLPNLPTPYSTADGGDFETNPNHFGADDLPGGINLWERGTPGHVLTTVNSGTNAWKTSLSGNITQADYSCALMTPNFNLSATGSYSLSFRKSMDRQFVNAPFGVQVQYSTDNGANWSRLGTDNDGLGTNWYDKGPNSGNSLETNVIHDRYGFNDNYDNELTTYDVSGLAGNETVGFRFVIFVNGGYSGGYLEDGFMIDDFELSGPANDAHINITENAPGSMISFDGTDDYVPLADLMVNESFTAEMWITPNNTNDGQTFLGKHDGSGNDIFRVGYGNSGIEVAVRGQSHSAGSKVAELQHLAVSVEKLTVSTSEVTVYRDGNLEWQNTLNEVIGDPSGLAWVLGQDWDGGVPSDHFNGSVDELRLWNTVRTEQEIRENAFLILNGLDTDLIGYWQFNENSGTTTSNSLTSNTGNLTNGALWTSSTAPVGSGSSYTQTVSADGPRGFGSGLSIDFNGVSGTLEVVVFEINRSPVGTVPGDEYTLSELMYDPHWIINSFGAGSFSDASLTYTFGSGAFTETDPAMVYLFKRGSKSGSSWDPGIAATSVNAGTGTAVFDNITSFSQTAGGSGDGAPLPVELVSFRGSHHVGAVVLTWETASELNNDRFEVWRSGPANGWHIVGIVDSQAPGGTSSKPYYYDFRDGEAFMADHLYYQLKQVDHDGTVNHSEIIRIALNSVPQPKTDIFPNPADTYAVLKYKVEAAGTVSIRLVSLLGRHLLDIRSEANVGHNAFTLSLLDYSAGVYLLQLHIPGKSIISKKLIIE